MNCFNQINLRFSFGRPETLFAVINLWPTLFMPLSKLVAWSQHNHYTTYVYLAVPCIYVFSYLQNFFRHFSLPLPWSKIIDDVDIRSILVFLICKQVTSTSSFSLPHVYSLPPYFHKVFYNVLYSVFYTVYVM